MTKKENNKTSRSQGYRKNHQKQNRAFFKDHEPKTRESVQGQPKDFKSCTAFGNLSRTQTSAHCEATGVALT